MNSSCSTVSAEIQIEKNSDLSVVFFPELLPIDWTLIFHLSAYLIVTEFNVYFTEWWAGNATHHLCRGKAGWEGDVEAKHLGGGDIGGNDWANGARPH